MKKHEKAIESEKIQRVPPDLDLTPYRDEQDFTLLRQLAKASADKRRKGAFAPADEWPGSSFSGSFFPRIVFARGSLLRFSPPACHSASARGASNPLCFPAEVARQ
jgi:hypothetical protein